MGRIKTKLIKRNVAKLMQDNPKAFKNNFEDNKKIVSTLVEVQSKKLRNVMAGYVTRLNKKQD